MKGQKVFEKDGKISEQEDEEFQQIIVGEEQGMQVNPFGSISIAWDNLNFACRKSVKTINKLATNLAYSVKHSNLPIIQRKEIELVESTSPAFLMGQLYTYKEKHDFIWRFRNTIWLSYRADSETDDSDAGWGCMIRVCQMVLAEALKKKEQKLQITQIIKEFINNNEASFSISRICEIGGIRHRWTSSTEILSVIRILLNEDCKYILHLENYNGRVSLADTEGQKYPLIVAVSNRIGEKDISKNYYGHILKVLEHHSSIGMIGGIGGQALYIVGHHQDQLIYLDPHYVQTNREGEEIFFSKTPRGIPIQKLAPSLAFCYYFSSQEEHKNWLLDLGETCHNFRPYLAIEMDQEEAQKIFMIRNSQVVDSDDDFQVLQ